MHLLGLVQGSLGFLGTSAFTSSGHTEVRAVSGSTYGSGLTANDAVIQIDLDGNGVVDMEIKLLGTKAANIDAGDFFTG